MSYQTSLRTVEDLHHLVTWFRAAVRGIESSNGYSASELLVAALERMMSPGVSRQWKQYTHKLQDPPPVQQLLAFVEWQRNLHQTVVSPFLWKQHRFRANQPPETLALQLQESVNPSEIHKLKCHSEIHKVKCRSEIHKVKCRSEIHKVKCRSEIHKVKCRSEIHKVKCRSEIHKVKCRSEIHKVKCLYCNVDNIFMSSLLLNAN